MSVKIKQFLAACCILALMLAWLPAAFALSFDAEELYQSIFVIYSGNAIGSGFAIGENCIITNAHVIDDRTDVTIATYSGEHYSAQLASMNETLDIAVLVVPGVSFVPLKVADLNQVNIGDDVCAIGAPNSLSYTLTKGVVSSKDRVYGHQHFIQTDAAINHGNSGGPLVNDAGEVIGVNTYKMSDAEGIGLAIPIDVVVEYVESGELPPDDSGSLSQALPEPSQEPSVPSNVPEEQKQSAISLVLTLALGAALAISLVLNVILAKKLSREKKKCAALQYDPTERTDFDIEFLD